MSFLQNHPSMRRGSPYSLNKVISVEQLGEDRVFYIHLNDSKSIEIAKNFPTIVPIRDPFKCIITAHQRKQQKRSTININVIMTEWSKIVHHLKPKDVLFLPIDLYLSLEDRVKLLQQAEKYLTLPINTEYIQQVASTWEPKNTCGSYTAKELYETGRHEEVFSMYSTDLKRLLTMKLDLIPFLQSLGYSHLPWF
jgi:hypothetical protein